MAYSNQTTHYGLPLPVGSDKSSWLDNNTAFAAIDTAIYQASTDAGAAAGDIALLQNDVTSLQSGKQDVLTFDATPTNGSLNPVRSGGIYTAIDNVSIALGVTDLKVSTLEGAMGNTDISAIGDGTVTGAISSLAQSSGTVVDVTILATDTYGSALTKVKNAITIADLTVNAKIVLPNGRVYSMIDTSGNFINTEIRSTTLTYIRQIWLNSAESYLASLTSTGVTSVDETSTTLPAGLSGTWKVYY